jgi:hypothetical protein
MRCRRAGVVRPDGVEDDLAGTREEGSEGILAVRAKSFLPDIP